MNDDAKLKDKTEGRVIGVETRLEHNGYSGDFEYDSWAEEFCGAIESGNTRIKYHGRNRGELRQCFRESIDAYLKSCREEGTTPVHPARFRQIM